PVFVNSTVMGLVTPCSVKSPVTEYLSPLFVTDFDTNVIFGNWVALKKSGPFRWSSRFWFQVETDDASTETLIFAFARFASSTTIEPVVLSNCPKNRPALKCWAENSTVLCTGSTS